MAAPTAGMREPRHTYAIPQVQQHIRAAIYDDADDLVPRDDIGSLLFEIAVHYMEIGPANATRFDAQQYLMSAK
jgi:hypothetical protein